jgi:hypothetical protein
METAFAIRIRQTNLKPIETEVDQREYRQSYDPYVQAADAWGLAHYVSVRRPSTDALHGDQLEYFYDETGNSTFVFCRNTLREVPPCNPFEQLPNRI